MTRNRVAIKRTGGTGSLRVLYIGEAPGELEDKTGYPFVGIAGKILYHMMNYVPEQYQYWITNLVGCRPVDVIFNDAAYDDLVDNMKISLNDYVFDTDYSLQNWNRDPTPAEKQLCSPHVDEIIESWKPHGVIYLGKSPTSYVTTLPKLNILHPAFIARQEYKLLTVLKEARKIEKFIYELRKKYEHA